MSEILFSDQLFMLCPLSTTKRAPSFEVKITEAVGYGPLQPPPPPKKASSLEKIFIFKDLGHQSSIAEDLETVLTVSSLKIRTNFLYKGDEGGIEAKCLWKMDGRLRSIESGP